MALVSRIATESPISPRAVRPEVPQCAGCGRLAVSREESGASADELSRSRESARAPRFDRQDAGAAGDSDRRLSVRYVFLDPPADQHPHHGDDRSCLTTAVVGVRRQARRDRLLDRGVLLRDHRGRVGRIAREGTLWLSSGDEERSAAAARASSTSSAGFSCRHGWRPARSCRSPASCIQCTGSSAIAATAVQIVVQALFLRRRAEPMDLQAFTNGSTRTRTVVASAVGVHALVQSAPQPGRSSCAVRDRLGRTDRATPPVRSPIPAPRWDTTIGFGARCGCGSPERMPIRFRMSDAFCGDPHGRAGWPGSAPADWRGMRTNRCLVNHSMTLVTRPQSWATVRGWLV